MYRPRGVDRFMIELTGITKYYGQIPAVEDVSFSVGAGEIIGFLGPNGAGKTTTLRILTGFTWASRGSAKIAGHDINQHPIEVKRRVGYLPENVPLYREMVVRRFLAYVAEIKGLRGKKRSHEVSRVMERCGLAHMAGRTIGNLSKGYRQRVGLAQALIGNPPVLVLDEPTVGLDPRQIIEIREMIKSLANEHTVLLSTHILPEVAMVCERVVIINRGRIVAQDSMENLAGVSGDKRIFDADILGDETAVRITLAQVHGVRDVAAETKGRYRITTDPDDRMGVLLTAALVRANHGVENLRERTRTLEDVFIEAIGADEGDAP
ncbi:MAG TPA: ABC transporter ATP-binding protein [Candidatus Hydrogenedentes bacterium]|nr:ABC transporter ATP-binding protein [Candidatus Hydrogenedentota bacterium]HQH54588.1 ABC transporter ATP-binding protein [Candidatus Hydrogenedentota bacterium]